ncbi:hypothetical protein RSAG8_08361, partial [Rhizoctonia solani AG-8 WAC10335]
MSGISSEAIVTNTKRETNYVHRGWSIGAVRTVSPWASSRIAANNQPNAEGTWYTRMTRAKRFKVQVLLEDISPVPEFEAAMEEALRQPTTFEKFQGVYRALTRWGDVLPLEIEMGSSLALTDTEVDRIQLQLPEAGERNYSHLAWLSTFKTADTTMSGDDLRWSDGNWATVEIRDHQWQVITIGKVVSTIDLLPSDLRRIRNCHRTYDDNQHASKTISSVTIRSSDYIELLSITYSDGTTSSRHGGGGNIGTEYKFTLAIGEHITEMLTWTDGNWLRGIQFITNMGRCSVAYGWFQGIPVISRSQGGGLVGFSTSSKKHSEWKYILTGVRGIWRYDLISRIPKENDVYSDYFGATQHGKIFNDRALIGNSNSLYISSVEVRFGTLINSVQFTYADTRDSRNNLMIAHHGGSGGAHRRFELGSGEYIVSISGKSNEQDITQLCFGTNRGRTSEIYGGGDGPSFSALSPLGESGNAMRLQYVIGKSNGTTLNGIMFVWTPELP